MAGANVLPYAQALNLYNNDEREQLRVLFDINETWWVQVLEGIIFSDAGTFGRVLRHLRQEEQAGRKIYPQLNNVFSWTRVPECKPADVKVIIVGQDPIPNDSATGISFLLRRDDRRDVTSIRNIFTSVARNLDFPYPNGITHKCPYRWCQQGVLLLNTVMTIGPHDTNHHDFGWNEFTTRILEYFIDNANGRSLHIACWWAWWRNEPGRNIPGHNSPIDILRTRAAKTGTRTKLIWNYHPTAFAGNAPTFIESTTGQAKGFFTNDGRSHYMWLFRDELRYELTTIDWSSIRDPVPEIPNGVIHPPMMAPQQQQQQQQQQQEEEGEDDEEEEEEADAFENWRGMKEALPLPRSGK